jgi:hypothetical protein
VGFLIEEIEITGKKRLRILIKLLSRTIIQARMLSISKLILQIQKQGATLVEVLEHLLGRECALEEIDCVLSYKVSNL